MSLRTKWVKPAGAMSTAAAAVMLATMSEPAEAAPAKVVEAASGPVCGDRSKVIDNLSAKYNEEPSAFGVSSNGGLVELLTAPDGKTWTLLFTYPNGPSCFVASGEAWQDLKEKLELGPAASYTPEGDTPGVLSPLG
jgi:hypothetical protein